MAGKPLRHAGLMQHHSAPSILREHWLAIAKAQQRVR
jgi:hypothetical protein